MLAIDNSNVMIYNSPMSNEGTVLKKKTISSVGPYPPPALSLKCAIFAGPESDEKGQETF